ncbi:MAG: Trm112 family protein [Candidatus Fermentibacteria bacterium]|nr:Trm112 family protein [Candidatus Fermentibacteria bacterium]
MVDPRLLEILVCPGCKGELEYRTEGIESLICHRCALVFPVRDDIPVMLMDEAEPFKEQ